MTLEVTPDLLGIARREQEEISKLANWAGYHSRPSITFNDILYPPCTVTEYLKRYDTSKHNATYTFVSRLESCYSADPGVSIFKEEFLAVYGHQGGHFVTLLPIAEIKEYPP